MVKKSHIAVLIVVLVVAVSFLPTCGARKPVVSEQEVEQTVQAAVVATNAAATEQAAAISTAVAETMAAETESAPPATPTPADTATAPVVEAEATTAPEPSSTATAEAAAPTATSVPPTPISVPPSPTPADTVTMSEEELAALIDTAVNEAVAASAAATDATEAAAEDGSISEEEVEELEALLMVATYTIEAANALIMDYYGLYAAYAEEALFLLTEIEQDLEYMAESMAAITAIVEHGAEAATAAITQLEEAAAQAAISFVEAQQLSQTWGTQLQRELQARVDTALAVPASQIATDRQSAILSVEAYIESVRSSLADSVITAEELARVSLDRANATASLKAQGGR
ncbi:MAG: hypothetical protein ACUVWR_13140 [Anaerolineae bacterium]